MSKCPIMDSASNLLQLVHEGSQHFNLREPDLIRKLDEARKQLQSFSVDTLPRDVSALVVCHTTTEVLAFLVRHRPLAGSVTWHNRVTVLEIAIASAVRSAASSKDAVMTEESRDLHNMFKVLFQTLSRSSQTPQHTVNGATVMTKLCVLLAICWLSYDRVGSVSKAVKVLNLCSNLCKEHKVTQILAKWPLFLLGMVKLAEKRDDLGALECFQGVVEKCEGFNTEDGAFLYWNAVALMRNGRQSDAAISLDKCVQLNYEPAACLSLQALMALQAKDCYAASIHLQHVMEIDFMQPASMFNYGLLMVCMGNYDAQQQLLAYILEFHGNHMNLQTADDTVTTLDKTKALDTLFNQRSLTYLLPSHLTSVSASMVHWHIAIAAMENGCWIESKRHFEVFLGKLNNRRLTFEAARDYVYVLLQCKLPSLALSICEEYLSSYNPPIDKDNVEVALSLLHLYKADALMCSERVAESREYLQQVVQPRLQSLLARCGAGTAVDEAVAEEIVSCHTQLMNNLAVTVACCSGVDPAISILREGLQQYPNCLAIQFNLVLLLLRKEDISSACAVWSKARGWRSFQSEANEVTESKSPKNLASAYQTAAVSASSNINPSISEHVQGNVDGEGGVSAQQLVYLDALISNYWRKSWESQLVGHSLRLIKNLESREYIDLS